MPKQAKADQAQEGQVALLVHVSPKQKLAIQETATNLGCSMAALIRGFANALSDAGCGKKRAVLTLGVDELKEGG